MRSHIVVILANLLIAIMHGSAFAQVVVYEADLAFPDELGWSRFVECDPERWLDDGILHHSVDDDCDPPPFGDYDVYTRPISEFIGSHMFAEFRLMSDGPNSEIIGNAPSTVNFWGNSGINYNFTIAADEFRFCWDDAFACVRPPLVGGVMDTIRLEIEGAIWFRLFLNNELVLEGVPQGDYPTINPAVNFMARSWHVSSNTQWDYIRFGVLQTPASGDFDSSGAPDSFDYRYFHECRAQGGPNTDVGPGCTWADMDQDGDVDFHDFRLVQIAFTGPAAP